MSTNDTPKAHVLLKRFLDADGQLTSWPSKQTVKLILLEYMVTKFNFDTCYSEAQVNDVLKQWHTFNDWAVLRRALIDEGFMSRDRNGSNYRRLR